MAYEPRPYERVFQPEGGKQMTKQSDALESDVNHIMARWISHGVVRQTDRKATYGDFSRGVDYLAALVTLRKADEEFSDLPSAVRDHVHNNPAEFIDLVYKPERRKELEDLGMVPEAVPEAAPQKVIVVEPEGGNPPVIS